MADAAAEPTFQDQYDEAFASTKADINAAYVLISGFLVFFMQAGFCMLTAGSIRAKNARGIILKNLIDACLAGIVYYTVGWAFAGLLESDGNSFIGTSNFALHGLPAESVYLWWFQFAFAASTVTIVSGALAERATFASYFVYAMALTGFIYPTLTHWIWSPSGWISAFRSVAEDGTFRSLFLGCGAYDFAGSGAVHLVGGVAAWVGAKILGPRVGRYDANGKPVEIPGHSVALAVLGAFILWFGWYGFNPGSALAIVGVSGLVARVAVTTTLGGAAGGLTSLFTKMAIEYMRNGRAVFDVMVTTNGALGGLASITAGCALVDYWAAIVIGIVGGWACMAGSYLNAHKFGIDDPVDASAVHMWAGGWGVFAVGLFARSEFVTETYGYLPGTEDGQRYYGGFMGGGGKLLGAQVVYLLVVYAWVGGLIAILFFIMKYAGFLRVPPELEVEGADSSHYGGHAYTGLMLGKPSPSDHSAKDAYDPSHNGQGHYVDSRELEPLKQKLAKLELAVQAMQAKGGMSADLAV